MKPNFKRYLFSGLACASLLTGAAMAIATTNGDMYLGFYQVDGSGLVGTNTYVFNLGPASIYRENAQTNVLVSAVNTAIASANIAADLEAAFGATWADDGTVFWGIFGGLNQTTTGLVGGDTQGTSYISNAVTNFVASGSSSSQPLITGGPRATLRNNIEAYQVAHNGTGTVGANERGAILETSILDTLDKFVPPTVSTYFGIGHNPLQRFDAGLIAGSTNLEGALDLWRIAHSSSTSALLASGADLTSGLGAPISSTAPHSLGYGQFCGTITLDTAGNLRVGGTAVATNNFASWATRNNVTGGANGDSDNDGIGNLVEYALNLNPAASDGAPGTYSAGLLSFAKRPEAVANNDVVYTIQTSSDLGITDQWQTVTATSNTPTAITYLIPSGSPKKFARLQVNTTP